MKVNDAIRTRRSIRKYKSDGIPKDLILELLEAAVLAPSGANRQPWEFVVVHRSYLDQIEATFLASYQERIADASDADFMRRAVRDIPIPAENDKGDKLKGLERFYRTLGGAPVAILVTVPKETDPWARKNHISGAAAAIENLMLAAHARQLGTCWLTGPLKVGAGMIATFFDIPDTLEIVAIVALGYPDHQPPMPPKQPASQKVRWIGFDDE